MVTSTTSTTSVSGLASGLDTAGIISQLMAIEARPQNILKSTLASTQSAITTLQSLNAQVAGLATQATTASTGSGWAPSTVTSSVAGVTATASGTGGASLDLHVLQVASAAKVSFGTTAGTTDVVTSGGVVALTVGSTTSTLDVGNGSLGSLVRAINAGNYGVTASTVTQSDGTFRLSLQSTTTGTQSLSLTGVDGLGPATTTAGRDAQIVVGSDTLSSPTNTFTAVSGLSITVTAAAVGQDASISVSSDTAGAQAQAQSMVDNLNALLSNLDAVTAYSPTTKTHGPLSDDGAVSSLRTNLFNSVFPTDGTSLATYGIQTDRYGKLVFDPATFAAAYAKNPSDVSAALGGTTGFAARVAGVTKAASDPVNGSLTKSLQSRGTVITRTQGSIGDWDIRLALKQQSLTMTYSALETALQKLQSQGTWLTSQLNALNPPTK